MRIPARGDRALLVLIALSLGAAYAVYWVLRHPQRLNVGLETDWLVLTLLAVALSLLSVGLLFVLLRNLIKLLVERRRRVLGSRFRTKLVFIFLVLVLIPSVVLFYAAVSLILQVNETLFPETRREVVESARKILEDYNDLVRVDCERGATLLAGELAAERLLEPGRGDELRARTRAWRERNGIEFVAVYAWPREPGLRRGLALVDAGVVPPTDGELGGLIRGESDQQAAITPGQTGPRLADLAREAFQSGQASNRLDRAGGWLRASAAVPVPSPDGRGFVGAIVAGRYIPPETAGRAERVDEAFKTYRQTIKRQPDIRRIYIQLLAILTLLVLFAGTWTGLYLARQITVPIQALVAGTQEIAAGNLDHRVEALAGDELGFLIEQFNAMTGELRSSREAVTASRLELEASNLQLEERRRYIEQLLENVPAAVISLDGEGVVTTMNRAAYRILGIDSSATPAGRTAADVFERRELGPLLHELEAILRGEGLPHVQEFELSVEGRVVHVSANLSPRRDAEGRVQGVLIVMEDLTPLIRAQRTTAWSEVARRIAHEIKNPLTPIQLSAQRILKKLQEKAEDFPRVVEESASAIVKEVGTLKDLVDEFSRFARMPAVKPVPNDANAIVEAALSLLEGIQPGIRFVRELQPALPRAPIDADQMKRVLVNLIDNASAAMDGRGTIALRTRSVPEERIVRIEVEDDGPGIPPENKERLFVPYFSTKKRGTGLGLAIANRIVSDHNGYIRVEDNSPRGARFVIELPA